MKHCTDFKSNKIFYCKKKRKEKEKEERRTKIQNELIFSIHKEWINVTSREHVSQQLVQWTKLWNRCILQRGITVKSHKLTKNYFLIHRNLSDVSYLSWSFHKNCLYYKIHKIAMQAKSNLKCNFYLYNFNSC